MVSGRVICVIAALVATGLSCGGPSAPSCTDSLGRGAISFNELRISCNSTDSAMQCAATADNGADLYVYCPMSQDVTQHATWSVGDPTIVTLVAPGRFEARVEGNTYVRAAWNPTADPVLTSVMRPVSVFAGTGPMPTMEIFGSVYQRGSTPATGAINGAVVQILDGLVTGRLATSGMPPPLLPGYFGPFGGPGYYRLLGVPAGSYHLRITREGYADQEVSVTVTTIGSPVVDFQLVPVP